MNSRKPLVISAPKLGDILANVAKRLKNKPDDFYQVAYDSRLRPVQSDPSLAVVITFHRKTLRAKSLTIASTKRAVKDWNAAHGVKM